MIAIPIGLAVIMLGWAIVDPPAMIIPGIIAGLLFLSYLGVV